MAWLGGDAAAKALGVPGSTLRKMAREGRIGTKPKPDRPADKLYRVDEGAPVAPSAQLTPREQPGAADDGADELAAMLGGKVAAPEPAPEKSGKAPRVWRVAGIWDVHVPDHDTMAFEAVLQWLRAEQPDELIIGGDFGEFDSCSQHGGVASPRRLVDEAKGCRKYLGRLREALPAAVFTYLGGNHEDRIRRIQVAFLPTFEGAITIERLLDFDAFGVRWVPYKRLYQPTHPSGAPSKLRYIHGVYANKYHAFKHMDRYGVPIRYGHVHTSQTHLRGRSDGSVFGAFATPCLRTLEPSWLDGPSDWVHGFSIDDIMEDGGFTAHTVVMTDRQFAWNGKVYEGRP